MEKRNSDPLLAQGFRDVDKTSEDGYARCVQCLDTIRALPQFQKAREVGFRALSLEEISPIRVLDLGCGLGHDTRAIAHIVYEAGSRAPESKVVGLDKSNEFLVDALARSKDVLRENPDYPLSFRQGDITALGKIPNLGAFDRIWEERTFQHIPKDLFVSTLESVYQRLSPGGLFVSNEPNWEFFSIASEDVGVSRVFTHFWADSFNHGLVAQNLLLTLPKVGFKEVTCEPCEIHFRSFKEADIVFDITRSIEKLVSTGALEQERATKWLREQNSLGDDFLCTLSMWIVAGRR